MAKIYTKQGDTGQTSLFGGARVNKADLRIHMVGELDELNGFLGLALSSCQHAAIRDVLTQVQHHLFNMGAELATPKDSAVAKNILQLTEDHITQLEKYIDDAEAQLPPLKEFILPGGSVTAAQLHVSRAICRRAERIYVVIKFRETSAYSPIIIKYLNRLSDLLFVLARLANKLDGHADVPWQPAKKE